MSMADLQQSITEPSEIDGGNLTSSDKEESPIDPTGSRGCRDFIFLLCFHLFVSGGIIFLALAGAIADPQRMLNGSDNYGNTCGKKNSILLGVARSGKDFSDKPVLLLEVVTAANARHPIKATCVEKCPPETSFQIGSRCLLPVDIDDLIAANSTLPESLEGLWFDDLIIYLHTWREICYIALVGFGFTILIVLLIRIFPALFLWLTLIFMIGSFFGAAAYLLIIRIRIQKEAAEMKDNTNFYDSYDIKLAEVKGNFCLIFGIALLILGIIVVAPILKFSRSFRLLKGMGEEGRRSVADMPSLLLQPIWTCFWLAAVMALYLYGGLLIDTSGMPNFQTASFIESMSFSMIIMKVYHFLCFLWVMQFIIHCQHFTVAGAVATWYFTREKSRLGWTVLSCMKRMYVYHLGSVAFGTLMTPFRLHRLIMRRCQKRLAAGRSCQCYLSCFRSLLELGTNAYAEIAIYGCNLCKGSHKAFAVVIKNAYGVLGLNSIASLFLFVSRFIAVIPTIFIGFAIMKTRPEITDPSKTVAVGAFLTFLIAHCVISLFEMINDTILICFWEDHENNNGLDKLYFTSKKLIQRMEHVKKVMGNPSGSDQPIQNPQENPNEAWSTNIQPNNIYGDAKPNHPVLNDFDPSTTDGRRQRFRTMTSLNIPRPSVSLAASPEIMPRNKH